SFLTTIRITPFPTLFPYTTLFRSLCGRGFRTPSPGGTRPDASRAGSSDGFGELPIAGGARRRGDPTLRAHRQAIRGSVAGPRCLDRKSTRLNSSHVKISYAVFCLK